MENKTYGRYFIEQWGIFAKYALVAIGAMLCIAAFFSLVIASLLAITGHWGIIGQIAGIVILVVGSVAGSAHVRMKDDAKKLMRSLAMIAGAVWLFQGQSALAGDPSTTRRTISYHNADIIPISTEVRFTTLIELPKEESILEPTCGDKDFWQINWTGNLAYIKPSKVGSRTNINIITTSGNVYSFIATEVSGMKDGHADLRLFVDPSDSGSIIAMKGKPKYVSADAVEGYRKAAETAELQLKAERAAAQKDLEREKNELRATYPASIKHDYRFEGGDRNPFNVTAIYHDDRFTYIEATPQEAPALYEVKDNKPSLIQFEFDAKTNRYSVPKVLDSGYFKVGKQKLTFRREG